MPASSFTTGERVSTCARATPTNWRPGSDRFTHCPLRYGPRGNRIACVLGTRGGDYQPQLLLQVAIRSLRAGIEPSEAQARPRWMLDPIDGSNPVVAVEAHTPRGTIDHLMQLGHQVSVRSDIQHGWGPVSLITIDERGMRSAAADPRVDTATAAVS